VHNRVQVILTFALTLFLVAGHGPNVPAAEPPDAVRVSRLIAQLGSAVFAEREEATRALAALGPVALDRLRQAAETSDPEVRRRAAKLLPQAERRLAADRILKPRRVALVYHDTPVTEAVADLGRRTGLPLKIVGDPAALARRRLTLDTGDSTLWDALDQFCRKAGLAERGLDPAGFQDERYEYTGGGRRIVAFDRTTWGSAARASGPLLLADGPWQEVPTCRAGAVRIRALSRDAKAEGEKELVLEIILEPPLQWQSTLAVRADRGVGAGGQVPKQRVAPGGLGALAGSMAEEVLVVWDGSGEFPANPFGDTRHVLLRLGDGLGQRLRELSGTIAGQVRTPPETLAVVDDILQAAGRTVQAGDGSTLQVVGAKRAEDGPYRVHVALTSAPPELVTGGIPARLVVLVRPWWGRETEGIPADGPNFTLLDAQGRRFAPEGGEVQGMLGQGLRHDFTLRYQPLADGAPPARLLYTGRRTVTAEVPFTLRDVPLP
jgi:hypothetical protein